MTILKRLEEINAEGRNVNYDDIKLLGMFDAIVNTCINLQQSNPDKMTREEMLMTMVYTLSEKSRDIENLLINLHKNSTQKLF